MTNTERRIWSRLRLRRPNGCQFYRQKPVGDYIVGFFCPKAKLVIEVDGGQHFSDEGAEYDSIRDEYLKSLGLKVLRFTNSEVMTNIDGVVESVLDSMEKISFE